MPSAAVPAPTIFISYASEDRVAARALRDALTAAGLDVWYDENELGGGDAWDQKIRRQIRECLYFMPVISATTERRREGYFRREWRLAAERTLDMADDVTFLLPVTIDDTREEGARVPEKFLAVQWLRVPHGSPTPALETLCRRLVAGPHAEAPPMPPPLPGVRAPLRPSLTRSQVGKAAPTESHGPPPMPPFPPAPERQGHHAFKFYAEVLWWGVTAIWLLFKRLPRWARVVLTVWIVFFGVGKCNRSSEPKRPAIEISHDREDKKKASKNDPQEVKQALTDAAQKFETLGKTNGKSPFIIGMAELGSEVAREIAAGINSGARHDYAFVPFAFGVDDPAAAKFAQDVFTTVFAQLSLSVPEKLHILPIAASAPPAPRSTWVDLARQAGSVNLIVASVEVSDTGPTLLVKKIAVASGETLWSDRYPVGNSDVATVASQIASAIAPAKVEK